MSEWISVEDRLPEWLEDVLVYYKPGNISISWRNLDGVFALETCDDGRGRVTHWMTLPEPPMEGNND